MHLVYRVCCVHARNSVVNRRADGAVSIFVVAALLFLLPLLLVRLSLLVLVLIPNNDTRGTCRLFLYELDRDAEFSSKITTAVLVKGDTSRRRDCCCLGVDAMVAGRAGDGCTCGDGDDCNGDGCCCAGHAIE